MDAAVALANTNGEEEDEAEKCTEVEESTKKQISKWFNVKSSVCTPYLLPSYLPTISSQKISTQVALAPIPILQISSPKESQRNESR